MMGTSLPVMQKKNNYFGKRSSQGLARLNYVTCSSTYMLSFNPLLTSILLRPTLLMRKLTVSSKALTNGKSSRPDGFTNEFFKKRWSIIKHGFYNLCKAFQHNNLCLQSINSSFITLIPKVESPLHAFDFRPISLLNISLKLVTKLLANRLQRVIKQIIHKESIWLY